MCKAFEQMDCYILAGGRKNPKSDFLAEGDLTKLEAGYRNYARIFDRVKLVIKEDQARNQYLNYPHVCDESDDSHFSEGIKAALRDSRGDAVFIGSTSFTDFPLELPVNLVKNYNGEPFLGYGAEGTDKPQPLFGIYSKRALSRLVKVVHSDDSKIMQMLSDEGKLIPLPSAVQSDPSD